MEFKLDLDANAALNAGKGGSLDTGVHKVKIEGAFLYQTEAGNNMLDLELAGSTGGKATIFGLCIDAKWKSGAENYDYPKFQELAAVLGMKTGATTPVKRQDFNGVVTDAVVFTEMMDQVVTIAIQIEHDINKNNGKATKKRKLNRTFFETGHSLAEKQAGSEAKQSTALAGKIKDYETKAFKANDGAKQSTDSESPAKEETPPAGLL